MTHALAAYTFEVRELNKSEPLLLGNFDQNEHGFEECILEFARTAAVLRAPKSDHAAQINEIIDLEALGFDEAARRYVTAFSIGAGEFNVNSKIYTWDPVKNKVNKGVDFVRNPNHLEQVDLILGVVINPLSKLGWMFLHSVGSYSVKSKFTDNFDTWFRNRFPSFKVHWDLTGDPTYYKRAFDEGSLKQVTYKRLGTTGDKIGTSESSFFTSEEIGTVATHIHPKRRSYLPKKQFESIFEDAEKRGQLLQFGTEQFDEVTLKVRTLRGNDVSIDVSAANVPRIKLNIDEVVDEAEAQNQPIEKAVIVAGLGYIRDLKNKIEVHG
ncbi:MAG: hypothetical protein WC054_12910 [Candidatus Nanopelagicales bacterium]